MVMTFMMATQFVQFSSAATWEIHYSVLPSPNLLALSLTDFIYLFILSYSCQSVNFAKTSQLSKANLHLPEFCWYDNILTAAVAYTRLITVFSNMRAIETARKLVYKLL